MHRTFPFATLATGLFAIGFALFPVLARDVVTTELYDPFEPLKPQPVKASAPTAPVVVPPPVVALQNLLRGWSSPLQQERQAGMDLVSLAIARPTERFLGLER